MTDEFSLARVQDRLEIQHRIQQFAHAIDRLELELLHEAFHDDAYHDHGVYKGDIDGFIEFTRNRHENVPYSNHQLGNIMIEFSGQDDAFVETYVMVWQSVTPQSGMFAGGGDSAFEILSSGRYVDHFRRKNGRWAIQTRAVVPGSAMKITELAPRLQEGFAQVTRDEHDPALRLLKHLGLRS
ncbi:nuclear transport factor 2 family protein [Agreia sp. PsM10]|uniref:nuclear transport factor 2 family protein n=1 Tax=Agreia sp. PsM10 TaxID=3030533 RepID=UPI00263B2ACD|nr:nuclear transport factor 2 family protein [Agreia sp. PsM10]MDN4640054.1 nuclear transport factor 2 family protein [Agreia sp. PsM10]